MAMVYVGDVQLQELSTQVGRVHRCTYYVDGLSCVTDGKSDHLALSICMVRPPAMAVSQTEVMFRMKLTVKESGSRRRLLPRSHDVMLLPKYRRPSDRLQYNGQAISTPSHLDQFLLPFYLQIFEFNLRSIICCQLHCCLKVLHYKRTFRNCCSTLYPSCRVRKAVAQDCGMS